MADRALDAYLNDHLAGVTFGTSPARRLSERTADRPYGGRLAQIADAIASDQATLRDVMERLDTTPNPIKQATIWLGEQASRLKLGETELPDGGTGTLMAIETLRLGVEGKLCLWRILRGARPGTRRAIPARWRCSLRAPRISGTRWRPSGSRKADGTSPSTLRRIRSIDVPPQWAAAGPEHRGDPALRDASGDR